MYFHVWTFKYFDTDVGTLYSFKFIVNWFCKSSMSRCEHICKWLLVHASIYYNSQVAPLLLCPWIGWTVEGTLWERHSLRSVGTCVLCERAGRLCGSSVWDCVRHRWPPLFPTSAGESGRGPRPRLSTVGTNRIPQVDIVNIHRHAR